MQALLLVRRLKSAFGVGALVVWQAIGIDYVPEEIGIAIRYDRCAIRDNCKTEKQAIMLSFELRFGDRGRRQV